MPHQMRAFLTLCIQFQLAVILLAGGAMTAQAQRPQVLAAERAEARQTINFQYLWNSADPVEGMVLHLPSSWELLKVTVFLEDRPVQLSHRITQRPAGSNRYRIDLERTLRRPGRFVLQVRTGENSGVFEWQAAPLVPVERGNTRTVEIAESLRTRRTVLIERPVVQPRNFAFTPAAQKPLLLRREAVPDLDARLPFTIEFWMKTVELDQILLSTWDGIEHEPYPAEFMVDHRGHLVFFRGQPGLHQSISSRATVADGFWQHIAVIHRPETGWTRLLVNGETRDSLFSTIQPATGNQLPVALGHRVPVEGQTPTHRHGVYTGLLDELRFWNFARTREDVRHARRRPIRRQEGLVRLDFDGGVPASLLAIRGQTFERVASDLILFDDSFTLEATPAASSIRLAWQAASRLTAAFVVERSEDGLRYHEMEVMPVDHARRETSGRYATTDLHPPAEVVYYRVRQRFDDGSERLSNAVKIGVGAVEDAGVVLLGNYPNPFAITTTIRYEVKASQHIYLSMWDLSGQQVKVLLEREQPPGLYQLNFEAGDLPSGIYFLRLESPSSRQSRKMILTR